MIEVAPDSAGIETISVRTLAVMARRIEVAPDSAGIETVSHHGHVWLCP